MIQLVRYKEVFETTAVWSDSREPESVMDNNKANQFVDHPLECRERLTDLMPQDERFRRRAEAAHKRQVKRIAEILEKRDETVQQQQQQKQQQQGGGDQQAESTTRNSGGASGSGGTPRDRKRGADHQLQPKDGRVRWRLRDGHPSCSRGTRQRTSEVSCG